MACQAKYLLSGPLGKNFYLLLIPSKAGTTDLEKGLYCRDWHFLIKCSVSIRLIYPLHIAVQWFLACFLSLCLFLSHPSPLPYLLPSLYPISLSLLFLLPSFLLFLLFLFQPPSLPSLFHLQWLISYEYFLFPFQHMTADFKLFYVRSVSFQVSIIKCILIHSNNSQII